ncbi:hypothetical protein Kpol_1048p26 [Vanderwaltozyma polyspora DSM 70294]|uniref:Peroxisomal membrane protein PEX25 n=1 Tax=Vanderwaltozyma polyspora (strain ATCC 22028 / DSM 70294 / BCRC 21397 / CBS 2163 / NBRC 10782 / NRRL Y-8283 / UCD 57-17) TaxID=436907 RepID=A7TGI9_VANPO|nr:uncharacterized protein Kpol_1048p26 [Vanderwaltozyma polyspora DSM 70294]EDO18596.1 hypothetical protein Kpol_1048p26 [Vanderwaltozyma polyspora DSM 70294]
MDTSIENNTHLYDNHFNDVSSMFQNSTVILESGLPYSIDDTKETSNEKESHNDDNNEQQPLENEKLLLKEEVIECNVVNTTKNFDILYHIVGTIAGKDKLAKIIRYSLDLLRLLLVYFNGKLREKNPNLTVFYKNFNKLKGNYSLFKYFIKFPLTTIKFFLIFSFKSVEKKISFINSQLSTFRYILRFGYLPFYLLPYLDKLKSIAKSPHTIGKIALNETFLQDTLNIYYSIFDELDTLYKLNLWSNDQFYNIVGRHEAYSWQLDILLALKNNWLSLKSLERKELELQLKLQFKEEALELSNFYNNFNNDNDKNNNNNIINNNDNDDTKTEKPDSVISYSFSNSFSTSDIEQQLKSIKDQKLIVNLDLVRLSFDLMANTTDVFNMKVPTGTYSILSLCSGITGFIKIWINTRRELSSN